MSIMFRNLFLATTMAILFALFSPTDAHAWGVRHVGYTHVGPYGAYHVGGTEYSRGYGGYGGYHYGYGAGAYHYGYGGGAAYGYHSYGAGYGGGYRYGAEVGGASVGGVYRRW
jgi:hypothetical protein